MITLTRGTHHIQAPTGFSFTSVFFGFFPALFRGDWPAAGIAFGVGVFSLIPILGLLALPFFVVYPCIYNRNFIARKVQEGYQIGEEDMKFHFGDNLTEAQVFPMQPNEKTNMFKYLVVFGVIFVLAFIVGVASAM